ncbi:MAG: hypothetical protein ABJH06_01395 [Paraglaciecola sp.]
MTLNMTACHIQQQQMHLAQPLLDKVADALSTTDDYAKQSQELC